MSIKQLTIHMQIHKPDEDLFNKDIGEMEVLETDKVGKALQQFFAKQVVISVDSNVKIYLDGDETELLEPQRTFKAQKVQNDAYLTIEPNTGKDGQDLIKSAPGAIGIKKPFSEAYD